MTSGPSESNRESSIKLHIWILDTIPRILRIFVKFLVLILEFVVDQKRLKIYYQKRLEIYNQHFLEKYCMSKVSK